MKCEGWLVLRITVCYIYPGQIRHSEFSIYLYETMADLVSLGRTWPNLSNLFGQNCMDWLRGRRRINQINKLANYMSVRTLRNIDSQ